MTIEVELNTHVFGNPGAMPCMCILVEELPAICDVY